jgi:hypothetical protein
MKRLTEGKVIIAGDSHQNLAFLNAILRKEDWFDHFVHLGDHLDTFRPIDNVIAYSVKETCNWINEKMEDGRFIWLAGNHCISYLASYTPKLIPPKGSYYSCLGWTRNKAKDFNRTINPEWFKKIELCCQVGDWVCVHAGFTESHMKPMMTEMESIEWYYDDWEKTKLDFKYNPDHWIGMVGPARYGMDKYSSPVWVDFEREFEPLDETQQILGHTNSPFNPTCKKSKTGLDNWCIDNEQSIYCVWQDGKLEIKRIEEKDYREFLILDFPL